MYIDEWFINCGNLPKTLSQIETDELLKKARNGDEISIEKLVNCNIRLVIYQVNNHFGSVEYDKKDLVSVGNIGLMKAIKTFAPDKNVKFSIYATRCINNEILQFLRKIQKNKNVDSLDRVINYGADGQELKLSDVVMDDYDMSLEYEEYEMHEILYNTLNDLSEREREVIMLYFGFYDNKVYSQKEIASIMSVNQSSVSKLISKTIQKLSQLLEQQGVIEKSELLENCKIKKYKSN